MALPDTAKERVPNAVLHPIVRTHPQSGRRSIYINPIRVEGIVGLDHKEALPLLDELLAFATAPRFEMPGTNGKRAISLCGTIGAYYIKQMVTMI